MVDEGAGVPGIGGGCVIVFGGCVSGVGHGGVDRLLLLWSAREEVCLVWRRLACWSG